MGIYSLNMLPFEILTDTALRLRELRKKAKLSQANLAERSGVSLGSIKRFERTGKISLESFLKLLHILDKLEQFGRILEYNDSMEGIEDMFSDKTRRS